MHRYSVEVSYRDELGNSKVNYSFNAESVTEAILRALKTLPAGAKVIRVHAKVR